MAFNVVAMFCPKSPTLVATLGVSDATDGTDSFPTSGGVAEVTATSAEAF